MYEPNHNKHSFCQVITALHINVFKEKGWDNWKNILLLKAMVLTGMWGWNHF